MSGTKDFYCFELKEEGKCVKVRKIRNGKCIFEEKYDCKEESEKKELRKQKIEEAYYLNYGKVGAPLYASVNGYEIVKKEGKMQIRYLASGVHTADSMKYELKNNEMKEKRIVKLLSDLCLNNLEAENKGYSVLFFIMEVQRIVFEE